MYNYSPFYGPNVPSLSKREGKWIDGDRSNALQECKKRSPKHIAILKYSLKHKP